MTDIAIVTGGAGSIGRATGERLARAGRTVILADIVEPAGLPAGAVHALLDVRSSDSVRALIELACRLGSLCTLVNCHGILRATAPTAFDEEVMRDVLDVNFVGVARLCAAAAPVIADRGAIVTVSSITSSLGRAQGALAYQSSKAALEALTRSYAVALAPREVRVNCVAPGYLETTMAGDGAAMRARQGGNEVLRGYTPFGRLVTPEEVADTIAYLCSPQASGISGIVLPVDGGQRAY